MSYPMHIEKVKVPPIKIQGIKTKLVPFIAMNINWDDQGTYFEPFMGSGVVGFNLAPNSAVFSDTNPHLINFYRSIQGGGITASEVRKFLESEGKKLQLTSEGKDSYYYEVRDRFNRDHSPLDLLFLQRANFNGMMRFNSKGGYNVPFGRKPNRFAPALITRICNQIEWVQNLFQARPDWEFRVMPFEDAFSMAEAGDFFYLDPPYIDRHDGYYDAWSEEKALSLASLAQNSKAGYALSMWSGNEYRQNSHLDLWNRGCIRTTEHFYHVGAREANRNSMTEALVISPDHVVRPQAAGVTAEDFEYDLS